MAFFTKAVIGTAVAGTITLGAMVSFTGTDALDNAKTKLVEQASKIELFASNESQLVGKINGMKQQVDALTTERDTLQAQLDEALDGGTADKQTIADLQAQIAELNTQIETLESEKTQLETDLENTADNGSEAAQRINDLEAEIQKANTEAAELQETVDGLSSTSEPMTQEEIDALGTGETVTDPEPDTPEEPAAPVIAYDSEYKMFSGSPKVLDTDVNTNVVSGNLVFINDSNKDWTFTLDNGTVVNAPAYERTTIGNTVELAGKVLTVYNSYDQNKGAFLLVNDGQ